MKARAPSPLVNKDDPSSLIRVATPGNFRAYFLMTNTSKELVKQDVSIPAKIDDAKTYNTSNFSKNSSFRVFLLNDIRVS